jgi:hypothetical protein
MIANPAIPYPGGVPPSFTLNDLRMHDATAEAPSSTSTTSTRALSGMGPAVVLAIGAFIWLDPLHLFTPTEASPPAPAIVPSAGSAQPTEKLEIIAPLTPVPATKSVDVPAPVVRAPQVPAPVIQPRAASIKPESRGTPMDKTNTTVLQPKPEEKTAPPVLLTKPEEKTDAPIVLKLGDDTKKAPKPAATNDQTPVTE